MRKVSVVVSGGSSKGAYQIGFFKALKKSGLHFCIDSISATSIGVINAYAFLTEKLDVAEQLWLSPNINGIWNFRSLIKNDNFLLNSLTELIQTNDFIPCDFYVTLSEMSTMTARYFNLKGKINSLKIKLIRTSISIPFLTFEPLRCNSKVYFDGGVTDNIPITPIINRNVDILFIVHFMPGYQIDSLNKKTNADIVYIDMSKCRDFKQGNFNFKREQVQTMIEEGERYALQIIHEYVSQRKSNFKNKHKWHLIYYYFSGARFLSFLNYFFNINKSERITLVRNIKFIYKQIYNFILRNNKKIDTH